jgi:F-actin capping protein alpha subunit
MSGSRNVVHRHIDNHLPVKAMVSPEQAASTILRSAAPGHFDAVAKDVQIVGKSTLPNDRWLKDLTSEKQQFEGHGIHKSPQDLKHPLAEPLYKLLQDYQKKNFGSKAGVQSRVALTKGTGGPKQLLCHTFCEKFDTSNQTSGCWKATWTIDKVQDDNKSCEVSGYVLVHTYSHEEGNVQLRITKDFPVQAINVDPTSKNKDKKKTTTPSSLEDAVLETIVSWETEILGILASMNSVASEQLRTIRRVLPITKTKMKWDVVAHRSVKTLKKTAPESRSKVKYGKS